MISLNFTRTELELLIKAFEEAAGTGFPRDSGDKVRLAVLKQQIEKAIATLNADRWQGFNKS